MIKKARISKCGVYRYTLERVWDPGLPRVLWVLLNPSTADAEKDDHTLRKGIGFSKRWGHGGLCFVNLFAYRATKPAEMKKVRDPVGPENDEAIREQVEDSELVIAAWGNHGKHMNRDLVVWRGILASYRNKVKCLGISKQGCPKHPLTLSYETQLIPYPGPLT